VRQLFRESPEAEDEVCATAPDERAGEAERAEKREKIVVTSTFGVYPPQGGGQARIYHLYKQVAQAGYEVEIVSLDAVDKQAGRGLIAPHLTECRVPKSEAHQREEGRMERGVNIPITDIAAITLLGLTPAFGERLKEAVADASTVVVSHPYSYLEVKKCLGDRRMIYEAHNVEYLMKKGMLPKNSCAEELLDRLFAVEKECCEQSEFIMTCSEEDAHTLQKLYGVPLEKIIVVPNGVDSSETTFTPVKERLREKKKLGLEGEKLGLFMGSWHQPNLEACEEIFRIAEQCPTTRFLLMGSQCLYFRGRTVPENVGMLGLVSDEEKNRVFSSVDFALNPMMSGSGTNLKMFDYMSAGIPIITTAFGTRGIEEKDLFIIREPNEMAQAVAEYDLEENEQRTVDARTYVEKRFDWSVIAKTLVERLKAGATNRRNS
jgi:glycosyltransferase involved in cell wall biosynthesis